MDLIQISCLSLRSLVSIVRSDCRHRAATITLVFDELAAQSRFLFSFDHLSLTLSEPYNSIINRPVILLRLKS